LAVRAAALGASPTTVVRWREPLRTNPIAGSRATRRRNADRMIEDQRIDPCGERLCRPATTTIAQALSARRPISEASLNLYTISSRL